jgi:hypothetical protein
VNNLNAHKKRSGRNEKTASSSVVLVTQSSEHSVRPFPGYVRLGCFSGGLRFLEIASGSGHTSCAVYGFGDCGSYRGMAMGVGGSDFIRMYRDTLHSSIRGEMETYRLFINTGANVPDWVVVSNGLDFP